MPTARFRYNHPHDDYLEVTAEDGAFRGRGVAEAAFREPWGDEAAASLRQFLFDTSLFPMREATFEIESPGKILVRVKQVSPLGHLALELGLSELFDHRKRLCASELIMKN